jgi:O-antigen ligase
MSDRHDARIRRRVVAAGRAPGVGSLPASAAVSEPFPPVSPVRGIEWTFGYLAFLFYIYVITTYRINAGTLAMSLSLVGLVLRMERLSFPPVLAWMGMLLAWSVIGYAASDYPSIVQSAVIEDGKLWLVALVLVNVLQNRPRFRFFTIFFLGCFALYPVRGALVSFFVGGGALQGRALWNYIYANPNDLAAFCLPPLGIACGVMITEPRGWVRRAAFAGLGVLPFVILLTQSRGAFIGLAVFGALALVHRGIQLRRIVIIGLVGALLVVLLPSSVWDRIGGLKNATSTENLADVDPEGSARQRFEIMKVAGSMGLENPLTGVGRGTYKLNHQQYALRDEFDPIARGLRDTHSTYLNVFAETGAPGLILFLGMVCGTLLGAERTRRRLMRVAPRASSQLFFLEIGVLAYFVAGLFGTYSHVTFTPLYLALVAAATELLRRPILGPATHLRTREWHLPGRRSIPASR